jgi:excisionase family DNA binding protein
VRLRHHLRGVELRGRIVLFANRIIRGKEMSEWMSTKEAAEELGVTVRTLYRLIDEGSIEAYQIGRVIRVKSSDVQRYLESVRIAPGQLRHLYEQVDVARDE